MAALIANSDALLVDAMSMLVDTATYVGNLCAEQYGSGVVSELLASGASLAVLYGVAMWGAVEAGIDLASPEESGNGAVLPGIVLAFGLWGMAFDVLSCWGFYRWGLDSLVSGSGACDDSKVGLSEARDIAADELPSVPGNNGEQKPSMNMRSAILHVGADFLRSLTTVVEGAAVLSGGSDARTADAAATLIVSVTILAGGCGAGASWLRQAWQVRQERAAEAAKRRERTTRRSRRPRRDLRLASAEPCAAVVIGTPASPRASGECGEAAEPGPPPAG